ncbi:4Fe-4S ferredoxin [Euryarchaeota archaeon ex4484_178]|nr:MAG: 4Fe-4S ferredoxin [Euryarchaeota archaeon ex4484_178]
MSSQNPKPPRKRGRVIIDENRCKGCWYCIEYCPTKVLEVSEKLNEKGYHPPKLVEEPPNKVCIACHLCELFCPDFAIIVEEIK